MHKRRIAFAALVVTCLLSPPLAGQDLADQEIVVTGSRVDQSDYSDFMPAVGLRKKADFLVQKVTIRGDTRDADDREAEIRAMMVNAINLATRAKVELATGDYILTRLTLKNAQELALRRERRPDSEKVEILVKASLKGRTVSEAQAIIHKFVEQVPEVGRAEMDETDDASLSVVGPDSYRNQIIENVIKDANLQIAKMGDGYAAELKGLNMPVQWARSGPSEVFLYIPYELKITPKT